MQHMGHTMVTRAESVDGSGKATATGGVREASPKGARTGAEKGAVKSAAKARGGAAKAVAKATGAKATGAKATGAKGAAAVAAEELKKKELVAAVVERTGTKKKSAKPVVEATLAILGEAIAAGRVLNLQPLGKITARRSNENARARHVSAAIRQSKVAGAAAAAGIGGGARMDGEEDAQVAQQTVAQGPL
ncbi:MAG: hypothetical protein Kow0058_03830 [Roseovarius sp.]